MIMYNENGWQKLFAYRNKPEQESWAAAINDRNFIKHILCGFLNL